jgi:hypothetical protein
MVGLKLVIPTTQVCNEVSPLSFSLGANGEVIFLQELTSFFIIRRV